MARLQAFKTARAVVRPLQLAREREEFLALPRLLRAGDPVWVEVSSKPYRGRGLLGFGGRRGCGLRPFLACSTRWCARWQS